MGKAILASWQDDDITALALRAGLPPLTSKSLRTPEAALAEIQRIRARGWTKCTRAPGSTWSTTSPVAT